ncbi:MAG TPA: helix-turn-helix transcriptional regulator [Virgibacillus sp.]|nr:helix-turn-helix transcriptional regulator [Virgibacillus sp.]HLR68862.1 helix-turn-helix transcriptional regulator [Virgibacillus sp.]
MTTHNNKLILKTIGKNIREYRKNKGWSQEAFAFECGLHRTYIGAIERGERNITILNLIVITSKLEVTLNDVYSD